jgi:hypothetical protein
MTELNESEIRKMPFFVTWHTMFLSIYNIVSIRSIIKRQTSLEHQADFLEISWTILIQ